MKIDAPTRKNITRDYKKAYTNFSDILFHRRPNYWIKSEEYLNPLVVKTKVPLDDSMGELQYYKKICNCLTEILMGESGIKRISQVPDYVEQFFE